MKVYQASVSWDDRWFNLDAFYRTGHLHWQYEGDFFGLYRDAYYGENVDIYNGEAPVGFEIAGKKHLQRPEGGLRPAALVGRQPGGLRQVQPARWAASSGRASSRRTSRSRPS